MAELGAVSSKPASAGDPCVEPASAGDPCVEPASAGDPGRVSWGESARRVSGLVLCVVVPVQIALTHVFDDPARITTREALQRWDQAGWRVLDSLVLLAGAVHVAIATSQSVSRSSRLPAGLRTGLASVVTALCAVVAVFTTLLVATAPWS